MGRIELRQALTATPDDRAHGGSGRTVTWVSALAVRVLGELTVDGTDLTRVDRKARALLLLLALARGRPVSTDALTEALWGDGQPSRPADQVSVLASRLRRVLGRDRIQRSDAGYRLHADWLDLAELEAVVTEMERRPDAAGVQAAAVAAGVALALIRGPVADVGGTAPWAAVERAAAERLIQRARRAAAAAYLAAGRWRDALELATADSTSDPLDEAAVRTVMRAEVAGGLPALALAAYAALRERLADQLGADPAAATEELHTSILRGDISLLSAWPAAPLIGSEGQADGPALQRIVAGGHSTGLTWPAQTGRPT